ncbi:MAG: ABC transporter substrate-binding protein [Candidatus Methanoplasma sp.]|nr:ABC transporter substrate-binding protein [Candidatus Methanoplasma sp.]
MYTDASGREVTLEKPSERTALIFFRGFDYVFMLDEPPVASTEVADVLNGWASLEPFASKYDIIDVGSQTSPNLEMILDAEPDLIIVYSGTFDAIGSQLEKIATTVTVSSYGDDWVTPFIEYGKIFGKEDRAQEEIDRINGLLRDSAEELSAYSDKTFGFMRCDGKTFSVYNIEYVFSTDNGLGLTAPEGLLAKNRQSIDLEGLAQFNPDFLFLYDVADTSEHEDFMADLSSDSVWNALTSVKDGNVFLLDRSVFSGGPLSIEYGTEAISECLRGT